MNKAATIGMVMAGILVMGSVAWAGGNKAAVNVSANVSGNLTQTTIKQTSVLNVTTRDIETGYVDVPAGTILEIRSNDRNGYMINFNADSSLIERATVKINNRAVMVSAGPGMVHQPFPGLAGETLQITYRLHLNPDVKPGQYDFPLDIVASLI